MVIQFQPEICSQRPSKKMLSIGPILYLVFRPRTFLQCFAFISCCSKTKHFRIILGRILGQKTSYESPPQVVGTYLYHLTYYLLYKTIQCQVITAFYANILIRTKSFLNLKIVYRSVINHVVWTFLIIFARKEAKKSAEIDHCAIARETLAGLLIRFANLRCTLLQCQNVYEVTSEFLQNFPRHF